jgi:UDP-glucose 4-epimerase
LRDLTYIDCVLDAFLTAGTHPRAPGRIYNLGSGIPISLLDLVKMMIEVFGRGTYRLADFPADRRRIDIGSYYADISLIGAELGWHPRVDLREGLARTFDFYRREPNFARGSQRVCSIP